MKAKSCRLPLLVLGMSLVAATSRTAEIPPAKAAKAAVERGKALLEKEDYPAAIQAFSEALRLDPKSAPAHVGRGNGYRLLKKFDMALADFNEALRLEPNNSEAHRGRGSVYGEKRDFDKALVECDEAVRCGPNNSGPYRTRGWLHGYKGEWDQAVADFSQAIRLDPKDAWAFCNRARVEAKKGEIDKAIADLSEAMRIAPADYDAICIRGILYRNRGELDKALADFSAAIRLEPGKHEALAARGCLFLQKGEVAKARADLTNVIRIHPQDAEAYCNRGLAYFEEENLQDAHADFDKAIAINPKYANAYRYRAEIYAKKEILEEAIADCTRAMQLEPRQFSDYRARGSLYEKKGDVRKADADFAQARQLALKAVLEEKGLAKRPASKAAVAAVEQHIHAEVKRLEYSAAVAQELVAMTRDWNLAALEQKLAAAKAGQRQGKLSKEKLSQAEQEIAETLCREIAAVVRGKETSFELDEVIRDRSASCVGFALVFNVLGRSIGLDVQGLDVPITAAGRSIDDHGHLACLIQLADGRAAIVDVTGGLGQGDSVSKPFQFGETYREKGSYWELKDARNLLGLHPLVQPLDNDGIVSGIIFCRSAQFCAKGDSRRALAMTAEAVRRNPRGAWAYVVQGMIHDSSGEHDRAIADFSAAIQRNPLYARAYLRRGLSCFAKDQIDRGLADLDKAICLNPKFAEAYATRGLARQHRADTDAAYAVSTEGNDPNSPSSQEKADSSFSIFNKSLPSASSKASGENFAASLQESKAPSRSNSKNDQASREQAERFLSKIKHEHEQALADYTEAIRLDPKVAWYYMARGTLNAACGEMEKSLTDLNEALRRDPKDANGFTLRSQVYEYQGNLDKAIADMSEVIRLNPQAPDAYERRAKLYTRKHDTDKAAADFAKPRGCARRMIGIDSSDGSSGGWSTEVRLDGALREPVENSGARFQGQRH